ncbi:CHAD domain-containing protein [Bdellovibrio sp. NC01]|uniref:CHAD domain-containing protein n=1 Tax=Bdellovibrio sp. NC01 TaxID=2220073 RepID=UPI00115AF609|nr:CHAD domain-containing protein [Bdellovibrio sp. NC01]QDK36699.1 hypothetical protein DOE51_03325 [Bdellovibrio sp. NC01]
MESFADLIHKVLKDAKPGKIHRLRILTRQARAALWLHDSTKIHEYKVLRKLGNLLGDCRQNDVLLKDAKTYGFKTTAIKKTRDKSYKKLHKYLEDLEIKKIDKAITRQTQIAFFTDHKKELQKRILKPLKKWPTQLPVDKKELHKIRITTKKAIYRLEHLGIKSMPLKTLQKSLGRLHDLEVLEKEFDLNPPNIVSEQRKLKHRAELNYKHIRASGQPRIK